MGFYRRIQFSFEKMSIFINVPSVFIEIEGRSYTEPRSLRLHDESGLNKPRVNLLKKTERASWKITERLGANTRAGRIEITD
jgi:hypothetical protein